MGSNVGDRLHTLQLALDALLLHADPLEPVLVAPVYRTVPVLCPDGSPDFYNTVVEIGFTGTPEQLLEITTAIETQLGRTRNGVQNSPRTIDLDLLYLGECVCAKPHLVLPHPRLAQRRFVLQPLVDICPDWRPPGFQDPVHELLRQFDGVEPPLELVAELRGDFLPGRSIRLGRGIPA